MTLLMRIVLAFAIVGLVAGCDGGKGNPGSDGGGPPSGDVDLAQPPKEIPDGFIQTACQAANDCDDSNACTADVCSSVTHMCTHTAKSCPEDSCNTGGCDTTNGTCTLTPANESMMCVTAGGAPGTCTTGFCNAVPQCARMSNLDCSTPYATGATSSYTSVFDDYACATGLTGPEVGFSFQVPTDRTVTVSISMAVVDFDLIVLEGGACVATAKCAASATTVGKGNESVTFMAKGNQDYLIVVDGRGGAKGTFTLNVACERLCNSTQVLPCNQTIMGDTTGGPSKVNLTDCSSAPTPGPENTWQLPKQDMTYDIKLSHLTQDLDLFALSEHNNDCDGTCNQAAVQDGTTAEEIMFEASSGQLIVDSKGVGGPYQLEVACNPTCKGSGDLGCTESSKTGRSDDPGVSTDLFDHWACAPNETGNEVIYAFAPPLDGEYTFELSGLSEDLDLIVLSSNALCDPSAACVAQSLQLGTTKETVKFMADSTKVYYVIVDGKSGSVSNYTLTLKSALCPPPDCANPANKLSCAYREETRSSADPNRSVSNVSDWACDPGTGGPEVVYTFAPTVAGSYTVTLDGIEAGQNLDLVVLKDTSNLACDPTAMCHAQGITAGNADESVTFMADPANTYYIAVDGKGTSSSSYHIKLASTACGTPNCMNGNDSLSCNKLSLTNSNDASGATSAVSTWTCTGLPAETGPEFAHKFTPSQSGSYTVQLIGLHADLDLIVLEADATGACAADSTCVGSSHNNGNAAESVTFTADANKTYYFVVDGKAGAISRYTLDVTDGCQ